MLLSQDVFHERVARRIVLIAALLHATFECRTGCVPECRDDSLQSVFSCFFVSDHAFKMGVIWDVSHAMSMWIAGVGAKLEAKPE